MEIRIIKSKKAQLFTILAIALIVLTLLSLEVYSSLREKQAIKKRVETMDSFLHAIEGNMENQAYIAGYRIILLAEEEISKTGIYVNDIQGFFEEAFFNGSVNGVDASLMDGINYDDIVNSLNTKAAKINVNISMQNTNISVVQENPWEVKFTIMSDFIMTDLQGLAKWQRAQNVSGIIPVAGFEDPIYVRSTNGLSKEISRTPYEGYFNVGGDLTNLSLHFVKGHYINNSNAPSFLDRLRGDLSSGNPNGIESFVNTTLLDETIKDEFDPSRTKTVVDYIYFNKAVSTSGNTVPGMPAVFRIDDGHKSIYQLS